MKGEKWFVSLFGMALMAFVALLTGVPDLRVNQDVKEKKISEVIAVPNTLISIEDSVFSHPSFKWEIDTMPLRFQFGKPIKPNMLLINPKSLEGVTEKVLVEDIITHLQDLAKVTKDNFIVSNIETVVETGLDGKLWLVIRAFVYPGDSEPIEKYLNRERSKHPA